MRITTLWIIAGVAAAVVLVICGLIAYGNHQMSKIPALSSAEILAYTTAGDADAVITVGILHNGERSWQVYGKDGSELPPELHTYEIGSLSKTFTAALIRKAMLEGKIDADATIDRYLPLPEGKDYPTIKELLTHTSGYREFYFERPMMGNHLAGRNDFFGVTREMILNRAGKANRNRADFQYSNYGFAVLGLVLESVYETSYAQLLNDFAQNELGLASTQISDQSGDLGKYWEWNENDAYLPAGGITSTITDMLSYAALQLEKHPYFSHDSLRTIHASTKQHQMMEIHMDEIGMAWLIDRKNQIVWHNGATGNYNSYLGFRPETGTAVVVLSNLSPNQRIPATVLGIKLLLELDEGV